MSGVEIRKLNPTGFFECERNEQDERRSREGGIFVHNSLQSGCFNALFHAFSPLNPIQENISQEIMISHALEVI